MKPNRNHRRAHGDLRMLYEKWNVCNNKLKCVFLQKVFQHFRHYPHNLLGGVLGCFCLDPSTIGSPIPLKKCIGLALGRTVRVGAVEEVLNP